MAEMRTNQKSVGIEMREPLRVFAYEMERVLRLHDDHKVGWDDMRPYELLDKIQEEYGELKRAFDKYEGLRYYKPERKDSNERMKADLMHDCLDLANICMMMWDNLKEGRDQ